MKITVAKLLLFFVFLSFSAFGQKEMKSREKIRSLKIAFITQELDLSAKEAQQFWPVYNEYDKKIRNLERNERFKIRTIIKEANGHENITEAKAAEVLKRIHEIEKQIVDSKLEMDRKLAKIISKKKILKLRHLEREFVRDLMNKLRSQRRERFKN